MGRTLFIGDVHGCSRELRKLIAKARADRVVLVGDLFTRGPDPRGVFSVIEQVGAQAVLGNHDAWVLRNWRAGRELPRRAFEWLESQPWMRRERRWLCVHAGVNPWHPKRTSREQALHLRRWSGAKGAPHWWQLYAKRRLVVHGHDASQGLNDRRPFTVGLDTACVRGGRLTGYLLESDKLVSVRAKRDYARRS